MATRASTDIEKAILQKGFTFGEKGSKKHKRFVYCVDGKLTRVSTHLSHGPSYDVSGWLLNTMARQCGLTSHEFGELVDCSLEGPDYLRLLADRNKL